MPCIKELGHVRIYIYYDDHSPPHFHARLGEGEARIDLNDLSVMSNTLSLSTLRRVQRWARRHPRALTSRWASASRHEPLAPIR